MRKITALLGIALLALAACSKGGSSTSTAAPTSSAPAMSQAPTGSSATFHAYNVQLDSTEEQGSNEFQAMLASAGDLTVKLTGSGVQSVHVCPIAKLGDDPKSSDCSTTSSGGTIKIKTAGVALRVTTGKATLDEAAVTYDATSNVVKLRTENVIPKAGASVCKDEGCNPFFELTPFRAGSLKATATWDGIATGSLHVVVGNVKDHAYSAGGQPYPEPAKMSGSSDQGKPNLHVMAHVPATEAAVALENDGARPLLTPSLEITWP